VLNFTFFFCTRIVKLSLALSVLGSKNIFGNGIVGVCFGLTKRLDFLIGVTFKPDVLGVHKLDSGGEGLRYTKFSGISIGTSICSKTLFCNPSAALSISSKNYEY